TRTGCVVCDGQIYEARANIAALKQYLNQWAIDHPSPADEPPVLDSLSKLVGWCHDTNRWGWWRMFAGYGDAVRDYAFLARSGRLQRLNNLGIHPTIDGSPGSYLSECNNEIVAAATDVQTRSEQNAYGT